MIFFYYSVKKIQIVKGLKEMKVQEKETITMEVELSKADVEGSWSKDAKKLKAGPNIIITALGNKHCLTMSQLKISDGGTITFQAEDAHTSGKLIVTGECVYCTVTVCFQILYFQKLYNQH